MLDNYRSGVHARRQCTRRNNYGDLHGPPRRHQGAAGGSRSDERWRRGALHLRASAA